MPLMKGLFETSNPILVKEALKPCWASPSAACACRSWTPRPEQSARLAAIMREVGVLD